LIENDELKRLEKTSTAASLGSSLEWNGVALSPKTQTARAEYTLTPSWCLAYFLKISYLTLIYQLLPIH